MNRRDAIAAVACLVTISGEGWAQGNHAGHVETNPLLDTASNCVKVGLVCIDHCQQTFASGDVTLAACARAVDQMISMCGTLAKLASLKSPYLPIMAKATLAACQDCEAECLKHADKHSICKVCAEACAACSTECKRVGA
jgi:Cys-rich four helix bundle protein (predicted Tat secretion target)